MFIASVSIAAGFGIVGLVLTNGKRRLMLVKSYALRNLLKAERGNGYD